MKQILEIKNLSKSFGDLAVLRSLDLTLAKGQIFALIGPNGSGKTTLVKTIVGLYGIEIGNIKIGGVDIEKEAERARELLGYIPDGPVGYDHLTGEEFLMMVGGLKGENKKSIRKMVEKIGQLFPDDSTLQTKMLNYSRGSLQKVAFGAALLGNTQLLVIDEPVVGLDPGSIQKFGEILKEFSEKGAVLFVTHMLDFAAKYATDYGYLSSGKIVEEEKIRKGVDLHQVYKVLSS